MGREALVLITLFLLVSTVSALCDEGQIDINSASLEKLQEITQIGPDFAEQIISLRPFSSVDNLVRVSGIAEKRLEKIKTEGLACVEGNNTEEQVIDEEQEVVNENGNETKEESSNEDSEEDGTNKENSKDKESENDVEDEDKEEKVYELKINKNTEDKDVENEIIVLNPKDIKTKNSENVNKSRSAIYGLFGFCLLLGFLYFAKQKISIRKNEFR